MRMIFSKRLLLLPLLGGLALVAGGAGERGAAGSQVSRGVGFAGLASGLDSGHSSSLGLGSGLRSGPGAGLGFGPGIDPNLYADSPAAGDPSWRRAPLWDDGKAELCAYEVSWAHYGRIYKGRALLVLVKEPWNPALDVKADHPRRDGFEVLKLNHVRDVPTGIYTYHQMASVFWHRDTGALQKIAATSAEACGISYAEMRRGRLQTHGYFDGQGDREQRWPPSALPEDGLPAALRTFVSGLLPPVVDVFPSLLASRFEHLAPRTYRLERRQVHAAPVPGEPPAGKTQSGETASGGALSGGVSSRGEASGGPPFGGAQSGQPPAGGAPPSAGTGQAVELRLASGSSKLVYTFETLPPHRLLRFERDDGTVYQVAKCERLAYWEMHDPGGEAWLPRELR
jgi:hypothetical protein